MSLVIVLGHDSLNDPQAHASTSGRTWRVYAALGAAAILAYYLLPRASWAQAVLLTTVNAVAVVATLCAAVRASRFNRLAWAALSAGMTLATLANGPYYAYRLITGHALPFPGPVDVLWLMMYPCFVVALLAIGRERGGRQAGTCSTRPSSRSPAGRSCGSAFSAPSFECRPNRRLHGPCRSPTQRWISSSSRCS